MTIAQNSKPRLCKKGHNLDVVGQLKCGNCKVCFLDWRKSHPEIIKKHVHKSAWYKANPGYSSYINMLGRCYNPKHQGYKYYGAKGITVCDRWLGKPWVFLKDMGMRPKNKTLDRIDGNKGYSPDNCKWSSPKEQSENRNYAS